MPLNLLKVRFRHGLLLAIRLVLEISVFVNYSIVFAVISYLIGVLIMIPREILKKVRQIQIRSSRLVNDVLAGEYVSVFKGRGMEFEEVRHYQIGDDVRTIDWNVTAQANLEA